MESSAYDVIVVGAGMAGLTAAAYTARAGLKVLLCDKEKNTGGLVNSFEYKGFVFDGGIRAIENSGIVAPMLRQLGLQVDFLPSPVSIGIGEDVVWIESKASLTAYQALLEKHFPANKDDIAAIMREIVKIMGYMDVLYGIDNPLFMDLKRNPGYVFRTSLPWVLKYALTAPKIASLREPVEEYLARFSANQALIDMIAQHFFQKTPTHFALSYFSLYLDYRYPSVGTGTLPQALERFVLDPGGELRREPLITRLDPARRQAVADRGNVYHYEKQLLAADQQALPDLALGEDVPAFGTPHTGQLNPVDGRAGLAQRPDEPDEGSGEHDTSDDRHDSRKSPGSRAGGVIQDARSGCTHRCIATFRSTTPASWPSGMVPSMQ